MSLAAGQKLSFYEILGPLGAGGMGEVFRARDTRLDREVAIKVLPDELADDDERLRRFEREAKALAALNHQNVAGIFGIDQCEDTCFIAMELVPGEDLSERLARGPLSMEDAIDVGRQIAEGLEAAHEAGVVHRDLKPANVCITPEGGVKLLDFGLAKPFLDRTSGSSVTAKPDSFLVTEEGMVLGTPTYMSPEQARGKPVDRRTDIWAFGCVLYECLTGKRAFGGETVADILGAIVSSEPDLDALPARTPAHVISLLHRCLDKAPRTRLRDIGEARVQLERAGKEPMGDAVASGGKSPARTLGIALVLAIVAAFLGWSFRSGEDAAAPAPLRKIEFASNIEPLQEAVLSPDGRHIALVADGRLWVRDLSELEPRELPDTEHARFVFWSPDGSEVAYLQGRRLWRSGVDGRRRQRIADLPESWVNGAGAHWSDDGRIVFARGNTHLYEVPVAGGTLSVLLESPDTESEHYHDPCVLPGSRGVVFATHGNSGVDTLELLVEGERTVLLHYPGEVIDNPCYSPTGHLLFSRGPDPSGIWALPFSLERLEVTGKPFLVSRSGMNPSLAADGSLLYRGGRSSVIRGLVWVDREGTVVGEVGESQRDPRGPRVSPDGRWVAVSAYEGGARNIWLHDVERGAKRQLTFGNDTDTDPNWQDSQHVLFNRTGLEGSQGCRVAIDGTSEVEVLSGKRAGEATEDGRYRVFHSDGEILLAEDGGEPVVFHSAHDLQDRWPVISPKEDFVAFGSDTTPLGAIILKRFPSGSGQWQIHSEGGSWVRWNPQGDELFFTNEGSLYVMAIETGDEVSFDAPQRLFDEGVGGLICGLGFDLDPDGQRILCLRAGKDERPTMTLVENWFSEFE